MLERLNEKITDKTREKKKKTILKILSWNIYLLYYKSYFSQIQLHKQKKHKNIRKELAKQNDNTLINDTWLLTQTSTKILTGQNHLLKKR